MDFDEFGSRPFDDYGPAGFLIEAAANDPNDREADMIAEGEIVATEDRLDN